MIKAIIFDADGVMIQSEMFSTVYTKDFGITLDKMLLFFNGRFQECLIGNADLKEEIKKYLTEWKWNKSVDEFLDYWFKAEHSINQPLVDYVIKLKSLGITCTLGTNQEKYRTEYMMNKMGFNNVFNYVFSSAYIGFKKPEHEFYRHITNTLKLEPNQILLWDDTKGNIESAKEFGMNAEFYSSYEHFKNKMKDYIELNI